MKASHSIKLYNHMTTHKAEIIASLAETTQGAMAKNLGDKLGFKVSTTALCEVMDECGIPRRISKNEGKLQSALTELEALRGLLIELLPHAQQAQRAPTALIARVNGALGEGVRAVAQ